jgi:hypothetical protein
MIIMQSVDAGTPDSTIIAQDSSRVAVIESFRADLVRWATPGYVATGMVALAASMRVLMCTGSRVTTFTVPNGSHGHMDTYVISL